MAEVPRILERVAQIVGRTRGVDEYVVKHVQGHHAVRSRAGLSGQHSAATTRIDVTVYRDLRRGRGTATFTLPSDAERATESLVRQAAFRAARAMGPSWSLPPPSAPARVDTADKSLMASPDKSATEVLDSIIRLAHSGAEAPDAAKIPIVVTTARAITAAETVAVITSRGFASAFSRTRIEATGTIATSGATSGAASGATSGATSGAVEHIHCRARHRDHLALAQAMTAAAHRMATRRLAKPLAAGRYDLVLMDGALSAESRDLPYGWLSCIVAQTSATLERQGLTKYRPGQPIFGAHKTTGDPITITSDGTLPFGWLSRPFAEASEPVRRWPIVRDGIAVGLSLDLREASLRKTSPNGGVRNLVFASGNTDLATLTTKSTGRSVLRVAELTWLEVDARTGRFSAELGLAYLTSPGKKDMPVYGGALRGDVFALLARARLSRETMTRGWYVGPRAMRVADVAVG